jgi:hypothetical protein
MAARPRARGDLVPEKPRLYLESTIPSYLAAKPSRDLIVAAHQQITHEWWEGARGDFDLYIRLQALNTTLGVPTPIIVTPEELLESIGG